STVLIWNVKDKKFPTMIRFKTGANGTIMCDVAKEGEKGRCDLVVDDIPQRNLTIFLPGNIVAWKDGNATSLQVRDMYDFEFNYLANKIFGLPEELEEFKKDQAKWNYTAPPTTKVIQEEIQK